MKKYFTTALLLVLGNTFSGIAQELNCKVVVLTQAVRTADPAIFKTLEADLNNFMNSMQWTNDAFKTEERIDCSITINITEEKGGSKFGAEATVQSSRPVYNAAYSTAVFEHKDSDWTFDYAQYQPINFDKNAYTSELAALCAYYAYVILGFDYDSFAPKGGTPHFERAFDIINYSKNDGGWSRTDNNKRNRYFLIENLLNTRFGNFRQAYYMYHRQGLDRMYSDVQEGRQNIADALAMIENTFVENRNSMLQGVFNNIKNDEIIDIFSDKSVAANLKTKISNTLANIDPPTAQKFVTKAGVGAAPRGGGASPATNPPAGNSRNNTAPRPNVPANPREGRGG